MEKIKKKENKENGKRRKSFARWKCCGFDGPWKAAPRGDRLAPVITAPMFFPAAKAGMKN